MTSLQNYLRSLECKNNLLATPLEFKLIEVGLLSAVKGSIDFA